MNVPRAIASVNLNCEFSVALPYEHADSPSLGCDIVKVTHGIIYNSYSASISYLPD
jgi:hypothetical protein